MSARALARVARRRVAGVVLMLRLVSERAGLWLAVVVRVPRAGAGCTGMAPGMTVGVIVRITMLVLHAPLLCESWHRLGQRGRT